MSKASEVLQREFEKARSMSTEEYSQFCDEVDQQVRGDGWISVKERLPEKNVAVIVHISSGDIDVRVLGICDDDPNGLWYCYKGADEPLRFNKVTHWRPLPEPPRGENGGEDDLPRVQQRT